jgi:ASC-1-like (ASCH) protein
MRIEKKVQSKYFNSVLCGRKQFEVRLADFKCKSGDTLILKEQKLNSKELTGRTLQCEILYKLNTKNVEKFYSKKDIEKYGLIIFSIRRKYK